MAKNPQFHGRSKHIASKYHFIQEQVLNGKVELKYCKTDEMIADLQKEPVRQMIIFEDTSLQ